MSVIWALVWLQPLVAASGVALAGVAALRSPWPRAGAAVHAVVLACSALGLALYAASEDDYRGNGISRWEAYDAKELTAVAVAVGAATALALVFAAFRDRRRLGIGALIGSGPAAVLAFVAFLANSLN